MDLKPHPQWGLNETHLGCYSCGKRFDEVVMLGDALDAKAPPVSIFAENSPYHRICDVCQEHMDNGIIFVLVKESQVEGEYNRTGCYMAITEERVREMWGKEDADEALEYRLHLCTPDTWEMYGFPDPTTIKEK